MKKKILVIGDPIVGGATFCGMMGYELISESMPVSLFEFLRAANGHEAYDKLLETPQGELPDLVVVDYGTPGLSGLELLKFIRTQPTLEKLFVVMIANQPTSRLQISAKLLNCECFKPADIRLLCQLLMERWKSEEGVK